MLRNLFRSKFSHSRGLVINIFKFQVRGICTARSEPLLQKNMGTFKFNDYDCIGFDLDNTLLHYNLWNMVQFEYDVITNFLVEKKGYSPKNLKASLTLKDLDFLQKGLFLDFKNGNILKMNPSGRVYRASHGTKFLSKEEIGCYYPNNIWKLGELFCKDPLVAWNGPLSLQIRTLLDCFDMPASLVFARCVDTVDEENGGPLKEYKIWPDILDAFANMYCREQLKNNQGFYFAEIKAHPDKHILKCKPETLEWIRKLKKTKKTFLLTGSNSDFVEITTKYAFGDEWKSLFDIIICFARKPGFFMENRPFYTVKDHYEDKVISGEDLQIGQIYNQGNWKELVKFFSRISGVDNPKCLYVGDNLLQDIYAPKTYANCDTMAIVDEQLAEGIVDHDILHTNKDMINSNVWGSFFCLEDSDKYSESFWHYAIRKFSKICIPKIELIAHIPFDKPLECFDPDNHTSNGYHPERPIGIPIIPSIKEQLRKIGSKPVARKSTKRTFREKRMKENQAKALDAVNEILENKVKKELNE